MGKRFCSEVLGTFILVVIGCGAVVVNDLHEGAVTHVGISLVFGLVVMAIVYALGDISGAHINPAVTVGFWAARRFAGRDVAPYIVAQLIGATLAAVCLRGMFGVHETLGSTLPAGSPGQSFALEVLLTAILMFVILCVSSGAKEKGIMAGAAIGSVIAFEALFGGPVSGASMNPARSLGPAIVSGNLGEHQWVYVVAPVLGSLVSIAAFRSVQQTEDVGGDPTPEAG